MKHFIPYQNFFADPDFNRSKLRIIAVFSWIFIVQAGFTQKIFTQSPSSHKWIATSSGIHTASGKDLTLQPVGNAHWLVLDKEISYPYEIRFQEDVNPSSGSVSFLWNYYLMDAAYKKHLGTGFNQVLSIERGGKITYYENVFRKKTFQSSPGTLRSWRIVNQEKLTTIYLNNKKIVTVPADDASKIIPSFAVQVHRSQGKTFQIKNLQIFHKPENKKQKPVIYQFPLPDDSGRFMTVFAHKNITSAQMKGIKKLPELFHQIEIAAGVPIKHTEPLIAIYEEFSSGNNLAASPDYPGWLEAGPGMLESLHLIAHEFAHFYFCLGGSCGSSVENMKTDIVSSAKASVAGNWMIEGFASYLGMIGMNRLEKRPEKHYSQEFGNFFGMMNKMKPGGWYDGPLDDGARIKSKHVPPGEKPVDAAFNQAYGKGYNFFYMIGSEFGHAAIQKIIKKNIEKNTRNYSTADLIKDLTAFTGKPAAPYFSGWIRTGPYQTISPADFKDENSNNIIDFAEK